MVTERLRYDSDDPAIWLLLRILLKAYFLGQIKAMAVMRIRAPCLCSILRQYRLENDEIGKVKATKVIEVGSSSGEVEIESIAIGDLQIYDCNIKKYHAKPDTEDTSKKLVIFGTEGFKGGREDISIYQAKEGTG